MTKLFEPNARCKEIDISVVSVILQLCVAAQSPNQVREGVPPVAASLFMVWYFFSWLLHDGHGGCTVTVARIASNHTTCGSHAT